MVVLRVILTKTTVPRLLGRSCGPGDTESSRDETAGISGPLVPSVVEEEVWTED